MQSAADQLLAILRSLLPGAKDLALGPQSIEMAGRVAAEDEVCHVGLMPTGQWTAVELSAVITRTKIISVWNMEIYELPFESLTCLKVKSKSVSVRAYLFDETFRDFWLPTVSKHHSKEIEAFIRSTYGDVEDLTEESIAEPEEVIPADVEIGRRLITEYAARFLSPEELERFDPLEDRFSKNRRYLTFIYADSTIEAASFWVYKDRVDIKVVVTDKEIIQIPLFGKSVKALNVSDITRVSLSSNQKNVGLQVDGRTRVIYGSGRSGQQLALYGQSQEHGQDMARRIQSLRNRPVSSSQTPAPADEIPSDSSSSAPSVTERLAELAALRDQGILDEDEYQHHKQRIVADL